MRSITFLCLLITVLFLDGCSSDSPDDPSVSMQLTSMKIGDKNLLGGNVFDAPNNEPILITFSVALMEEKVSDNIILETFDGDPVELDFSFQNNATTISAQPKTDLSLNTSYKISILDGIEGVNRETFPGYEKVFTTFNLPLEVISAKIDDLDVTNVSTRIIDIDLDPIISVRFSAPVQQADVENFVVLSGGGAIYPMTVENPEDSLLTFRLSSGNFPGYQKLRFFITPSVDFEGRDFEGYSIEFYTQLDPTPKFPVISDDELLTKIQEQTFKYFWDFGHPVSGLARERNTSGETVTIGGSGFGLMSIIVGIERNFITRQQGVERLFTIINFLSNDADRFHGVWSHWLNGSNGNVIPFSDDDDGADLVESAFMIQGLLTVRQYLDENDVTEAAIIAQITQLWEEVEWDWFTQGGQNVLFWHWSPNFGWQKNLQIRGWNESLIIYLLAASSTTHTIDPVVYQNGWARNGDMQNGNTFYDITLPLGSDRGGPLFFSHYSFLGLDPRNLSDQYANYWDQNISHSRINHAYCEDNPKNYVGYSAENWGLTASDNEDGYSAHSPNNDRGVITPTAAISSLPYTPEKSMDAIHHFYYILGDKLWGEYGFYDAFNITEGWYASSYLAIDQGPIICMIENHRSGLLWDLFMADPDVQQGLTKLGFSY